MVSGEELIVAARAVAARTGGAALALDMFERESGLQRSAVYRHFGGWRQLCAASGIAPLSRTARIPDDTLFAAMRDTFLSLGGVPRATRFFRNFPYSPSVLHRRFGSWSRMQAAFRDWAETNAPDFPHLDALDGGGDERQVAMPDGPPWPSSGARPFGEPIGFGALLNAPVNEQGVVFAFGALAAQLGFAVESVAGGFPDCLAKRRVGPDRWEGVRIEFEFRSRNFRDHGHDPSGCDLIVCWRHDWPECPLEVLELQSAVAARRAAGGVTPRA